MRRFGFEGVIASLIAWGMVASIVLAADWPQWGGPQRDLVWREVGIVDELPSGELPRMWSVPIGAGYSGPAVAAGRVFVTDRLAEENLERVLCVDADSGEQIWKHQYEAPYSISYPLGPRATPTVDGERVYTLGAVGHLLCFSAAKGEVMWEKHLPTDLGTELPIWGMAAAPLIDGDQLIVMAGGANGALVVSFEKQTGKELWRALDDPAVGYAPPVIYEFGGKRQLIIWHQSHISSLDPATGKIFWQHPYPVQEALTVAMPRKIGRRLFVTAFYEGPLMLELGDDGVSPTVVWDGGSGNELKNNSIHTIMPTPTANEDIIFGVSSYGQLRCLDTKTGEMLWETRQPTGEGRWWNAFAVPLGDDTGRRTFLANEQGELILAEITRAGYRELGRAKLIEPTQPIQRRKTVWAHPAFAMQSVFARNDKELVRVNLAN
jgi:outer membrane protein assembly factor BamB